MIRLRVVSDGSRTGTKVINAETGEGIAGVIAAQWSANAGHAPVLSLKVMGAAVDFGGFSVEELREGFIELSARHTE